MTEAFVTPEIITWARDRLKWNHEKLAKRVGVNVRTVIAWETGNKRPSQRQAARLAAKLYVPLGYLWLSAPPALEVPIPDLRTVSGVAAQPPSANFIDVLYDARRKQWNGLRSAETLGFGCPPTKASSMPTPKSQTM